MIKDEIEQLIRPSVEDMGYTLWGCEYLPQGKHSLLRIYIDKSEGIGISDCEQVSRQVSAILDVEDPISGNYSLEVSSPGIPRPLFADWQYALHIGEKVDIKLFRPVTNRKKYTGTILAVNNETLLLNVDGMEQGFLFSNIVKASLTVE